MVFVGVILFLNLVVLKLIFVFVIFYVFWVVVCCVFVLLCCEDSHRPKTEKPKFKTPQKVGSTSGYFLQDELRLHVPKLLFFLLGCFLVFFACWSKNTIKIGFFDDFEMLIFSFFGQKSRVNNLAGGRGQ